MNDSSLSSSSNASMSSSGADDSFDFLDELKPCNYEPAVSIMRKRWYSPVLQSAKKGKALRKTKPQMKYFKVNKFI